LAAQEGLEVDFFVADATRLPFPDDSFDICFSENLFEHVPEWQRIVSEASRVLKDDGVFFVRTSNRHCPINREINHMHFYPWLPASLQRPILGWVQRNRPAWINYSRFPAVNWFTHRGLAKTFRGYGFSTYETFDLVRKELLSEKRRRIYFVFDLIRKFRLLRYLIYPLLGSVEIVGVKTGRLRDTSPLEGSSQKVPTPL
jgi:SAM-dependent methyltransferase